MLGKDKLLPVKVLAVIVLLELMLPEAVILVICNLPQNLALLPKFKVPLVEGKKLDVCCVIAALSQLKYLYLLFHL